MVRNESSGRRRRRGKRTWAALISAFTLVVGLLRIAAPAQAGAATPAPSRTSTSGSPHSTVTRDQHHDVSPPLRTIRPKPINTVRRQAEPARPVPQPPRTGRTDTAVQKTVVQRAAAPTLSANFDGVGDAFSGPQGTFSPTLEPPDPNASVGATQVVETVNASLAVFSKTGTVQYGPVGTNTLFSGFGGACETTDDGDATVRYDNMADRWLITQFANTDSTTGNFLECVAVSRTSDATGAYNRYSFAFDNFPDYPKLAVWPDAYYITYNMFDAATHENFQNGNVCAMDRAAMTAGNAATQQCFSTGGTGSPLASDVDGDAPPQGEDNLVLARGSDTTLSYWHFHVDWATPGNSRFTGPSSLTVAANSSACGDCVPQQGTTQQLDTLGDRLMYRLAYRNLGDHESLVVNQSVTVGNTIGVRWYELRLSGGNPTVYQQSTYSPDATYRWMGSIAMDQDGDIALGYSTSSSTIHPQVRFTGRLAGDPLNEMTQGEGTIVAGSGSQTGSGRWGDYSSMAVDPTDGCTFWYTQEYLNRTADFAWRTRLASFQLPGCGAPPPPPTTKLTYTGPTSADYHDAITASATLTTTAGGPISGATVSFTLGKGAEGETCDGVTNGSGVASCTLTPEEPAGSTTLKAEFAGTGSAQGSSTSVPFTITKEETTLAYTGPARIANGTPAHLSGVLKEDGTIPLAGRSVTFELGSGSSRQTCTATTDTSGTASCTITPNQPLNDSATVPLTVAFSGDAFYRPSSAAAQLLLEYMTGRAYGLSANVNLLLAALHLPPTPDTGSVRTAGASATNTPCTATINTLLITADGLCPKVTTTLNPGSSTATTTLDDVTVGIPGLPVIKVTKVKAASVTKCGSVTGSTDLATLTIGGLSYPIPTKPNSEIDILGGTKIIVNEQKPVTGADFGLTVNALHIVGAGGLIDVTVASSTSDIHNCI